MKRKAVYSCLVIGLLAALFCSACSTPSWVTTAENEVPVIISGINAVPAGYVALDSNTADVTQANSIASQITGDLTLASSLIQGFQSSATGSTIAQIAAALSDAQAELPSILTAVHISDPTSAAKAKAIVSILQSEITAISQEVPAAPASSQTEAVARGFSRTQVAVRGPSAARKPLGARELKSRLNAILKQQTGSKNDARWAAVKVK